jgi:hypothetical protein
MADDTFHRRGFVKATGAGVALLTGIVGSVSGEGDDVYDFDPESLTEINDFVEQELVAERTDADAPGIDDVRFRDSFKNDGDLNDAQMSALEEALAPKLTRTVSRSSPSLSTQSAGDTEPTVRVHLDEDAENPFEEWNWERPDYLTKVPETDSTATTDAVTLPGGGGGGTSTEVFTHTQDQVAASVDYTAWRWQCEINWEYDSTEVVEGTFNDLVTYTNYAIDHQGTDANEIRELEEETYTADFEADFHNSGINVCIPGTNTCFSTAQDFSPAQRLEGDTSGNGEVLINSKDTIFDV